uniref:Anoctamin 1 n=1 Tax=Latimeria chalumnae TaxID=7897 RepID=H3AL10_LATCH
ILNSLAPDQDAVSKNGIYFRDGKKKVDYVLAYHYKKSGSLRKHAGRIQQNESSSRSQTGKQDHYLPGRSKDLEKAENEPQMDYHEDDKRLRRAEYEGKLMETGLELERDEEVFESKETHGIMQKIHSLAYKLTKPIRPKVKEHKENLVKHLSYPFSREKQHLFDLSDKDSFFDSKTRSTIVYEILKRTTCTKAKYSMGITSLLANAVYSAAYPLH